MRLAVAAATAAMAAAAPPRRSPARSPQTMEYLLSLTTPPGGRPAGVSLEYDCSWRELAGPYALKLQPSMTEAQQKQLHDALQLSTLCSMPFVPVASVAAPLLEELVPVVGRPALFVDAAKGSDSNAGTLAKPFLTIASALNASRQTPHGIVDAPIIQLRAGTFNLDRTLVLSAADSGLTIAAYQGEEAVLSGGVHLTDLKWTKSTANPKIWVSPVKEDLSGDGGDSSGFVASPGALPAGSDIRKANMTIMAAEAWCQSSTTCAGFTVRVSSDTAGTAGIKEIYFKSTAGAAIANSAWMTYRKPPAGSGPPPPAMAALQFPAGPGKSGVFARATLARHPNANAELDLFPKGYITAKDAQTWLPPKFKGEVCSPKYQCGKSVNLTLPAPKDEWHGMYQDYTVVSLIHR